MNKKYFAMFQENNEATINIYGDITSWDWYESDVSSYTLSKQLENLDVDTIHVYINSYGGEVAEGLAIYNALKRHKAKVITYCDGFACSIASVIFMAGDERVMSTASLLMIHNAWTWAAGNANELRKQADDLDVITQASMNAYMASVNITEEELKNMLDAETWISPQDALDKGFATSVINEKDSNKASQSVKKSLMQIVLNKDIDNNKINQNKENETVSLMKNIIAKLDNLEGTVVTQNINEDPKENKNNEDEEAKKNLMASFFNALI